MTSLQQLPEDSYVCLGGQTTYFHDARAMGSSSTLQGLETTRCLDAQKSPLQGTRSRLKVRSRTMPWGVKVFLIKNKINNHLPSSGNNNITLK